MIYQDVYSSIQAPTSMYGLRKQVEQDQLAAQQNQLALQTKARTEQEAKAKALYQSMNQFGGLSEDKQSAMYQTYRQKWESLMPEAKGIFPSVWDSKDPTNKESLGQVISFLEPLVPAEEFTLSEGQVRYAQRPGGQPTVVARGGEKADGASKPTVRLLESVDASGNPVTIPVIDRLLPDNSRQFGDIVYDASKNYQPVPAVDFFAQKPEQNTGSAPVNNLGVPGQNELPPRNFNAPSSINRAGETNVGFPIDENAMMQQPQIMPTMGNVMLRGAGAVMADEFAPQPRNALVGGGQAYQPSQSQFMTQTPQGMAFRKPAPAGQQARETFRDMTPAEINASGRDPARFSGQISSLGQKKFEALPSKLASEIEQAQFDKLKADAAKSQNELKEQENIAKKDKNDAVSLLRGIARIDRALSELQANPFFDTGTVDQYFMAKTDKGKELTAANDAILATVKRMFRTKGEGAFSNLDVGLLQSQLPKFENPMSSNRATLNQIKTDILAIYGVQAAISNKAERDALPPGTTYVDTNTGMRYQKGEK
jgi:hypothetical protein